MPGPVEEWWTSKQSKEETLHELAKFRELYRVDDPHKLRIDEWGPADTGNLDIDKKGGQGVTCRRSHAPVPTAETAPCVSLKPEKDCENRMMLWRWPMVQLDNHCCPAFNTTSRKIRVW